MGIFCLVDTSAYAASQLGSAQRPIRVAAVNEAPFVISKDKLLTGLAVDIFKFIAETQHWHYQIILVSEDIDAAIDALAAKKFDILIGPVSVTSERITRVDYGRPFFLSEVRLAFNTHSVSALDTFYNLFKAIPLLLVGLVVLGFFLISNLIWLAEKSVNEEMPKEYVRGTFFSLWVFISHFLKGGMFYRPKTAAARVAITFWFIVALSFYLIVTSTYTAYMTAKIVSAIEPIHDISDLRGKKLAYIKGEMYIKYIKAINADPIPKVDLVAAIDALQKQEVFGVVEDALLLSTVIDASNFKDLTISSFKFNSDELGFAYTQNSPIRNIMDRMIVTMQDTGEMETLCKLYLGNKYYKNCEF
ncbi:transporter substrate-binding domain-containing protein [Legionella tunisiensis]|uniref:transporter substrate-binding domain-containing protein n=1 Tax=Legionella tunisiensis TaxID=1034944 RepID=UPI0002EE25C6|nr:transporter substrate-binding domain-containing protein [Legionella tunisiensis]